MKVSKKWNINYQYWGGIGSSIAVTVGIMLIADRIIKWRYNNWGRGVYKKLQEFTQESYNSDEFDENNCIPKQGKDPNLKQYLSCFLKNKYDMSSIWDGEHFQKIYKEKIKNDSSKSELKQFFEESGGWEKFRELCTKEMEYLISNLNDLLSLKQSLESNKNKFIRAKDDKYMAYEYCIKTNDTK